MKVQCPCCKGSGFLRFADEAIVHEEAVYRVMCCHCMGKGVVMSEIDEEIAYGSVGAVGLSDNRREN